MKKKVIALIVLMIILVTGTCSAATYTLPEKMYNQLVIGSGLKGIFKVTAEGEKFKTPFMESITDADMSIRGIRSGEDIHYYVFQSNEKEEQSAFSELYRKDGVYYFRSDMVQGKVLQFPVASQIIEFFLPPKGENGSASSFIANILALPESDRKEKWDPVLLRYQKELEMWLADFTVTADTAKLESGLSALDFTYEIPFDNVIDEIVTLYGRIASDAEAIALLDTVMSAEEKAVYANGNLLYFYLEALKAMNIDRPVRMSKRVSAMGEVLRFSLELPLDEKTSGYKGLKIDKVDQLTVFTLTKTGELIVAAVPEIDKLKQSSFEQSVWIARIKENEDGKENKNFALRIDIKKTNEVYEKDEKTHEINHYDITATADTSYLPEDADLSALPEFEQATISLDLHYSSKYAQNSATTLEVSGEFLQGENKMQVTGKLKTAQPWLFMPFELLDPIQVGMDKDIVLMPYLTDWISNAKSMIRHEDSESEPEPSPEPESAPETEPVPEAENETEEQPETEPLENEEESNAETAPIDASEQE